MFLVTDTPVLEFNEADSDSFEFEEDLLLLRRCADGMLHPVNLRIGAEYLSVQLPSLARVFTPPKHPSS